VASIGWKTRPIHIVYAITMFVAPTTSIITAWDGIAGVAWRASPFGCRENCSAKVDVKPARRRVQLETGERAGARAGHASRAGRLLFDGSLPLVLALGRCSRRGRYRTVLTYSSLKSEFEELLPKSAPSVAAIARLRERLPGMRFLGVVIEVDDRASAPSASIFWCAWRSASASIRGSLRPACGSIPAPNASSPRALHVDGSFNCSVT